MLNFYRGFVRNFKISPSIAFKKAVNSTISGFYQRFDKKHDYESTTYSKTPQWLKEITYTYFKPPSKKSLEVYSNSIINEANLTIEHYFNLLGSGWTKVYHGTEAKGVEGLNYQSKLKFSNWKDWLVERISKYNFGESYLVSQQISQDYTPIDWQLDFKSGFRWNESAWYKDIVYGDVPGADIKVPWELGRMQYLLNLAYASILTKSDDKEKKSDKYSYDFQNQVLGFIASNPPRFGVQWMSSMDVGIRASNWLVAYDFFRANGIEFDINFKRIFSKSIYEHGLHIVNNLEWSSGLRGNHYLANITSLLFIAAFLPISELSTLWLAFAIQELFNELFFQFYDEGANFEGSTAYHLLSSEMIFNAIAIILALPQDKISSLSNYKVNNWKLRKKLMPLSEQKYRISLGFSINLDQIIWDRLKNIAIFSYAISTSTGKYPQIGDNDSGRFIKFTPNFYMNDFNLNQDSIDELNNKIQNFGYMINLDQRIPLSLYSALVNCQMISKDDNAFYPYYPLIEYEVINKLLENSTNHFCQLTDDDLNDFNSCDKLIDESNTKESGILAFAFPEFGLFVNKSFYYLSSIRCGAVGMLGKGGHSHNDQLSLTLIVGDKEIIVDPGTYVYTSLHHQRNRFRSVNKHNTLTLDDFEQSRWDEINKDDLFWLDSTKVKAQCYQFMDNMFVGEHFAYPSSHKRIITYKLKKLYGVDICDYPQKKYVRFHLAPMVSIEELKINGVLLTLGTIKIEITSEDSKITVEDYHFSPGYGILQKAKRILFYSNESKIHWTIEVISI